ncbi:MAG: digeranylgeranylglycerophospholipid reductase [Polaribacter sp.]|jgi:digeranylgeranylglycerophospholipid reductase
MKNYDVIIVGAGTAGLMLARELGHQKHKTLLLDRKKDILQFAFNTLGSFMKVEDFGISENVIAQRIDTAVMHSKNFNHRIKGDAFILDKKLVHKELMDSLDMDYVTIQLETNIKNIYKNSNNHYTYIDDKNGNKYEAKIFVDASGTAGVISKNEGLREKNVEIGPGVEYNVKYLGKPNEAHLYFGKEFKGGYGWIFPLKNNRAIIGFGSVNPSMFKNLKNTLNQIIESPRIKKLVIKDNDIIEGGTLPITPVLNQFVKQNLVCVGDSVSQVNPIVGEGYKFIFEAAIMASKAISKSLNQDSLKHLFEYEDVWKKRFLANYHRSKKAQERVVKLSSSDFLSDLAMLILLKLRPNHKNIDTLSGEYN